MDKQLYHACRNGDRDKAEELIDGGADVNWSERNGWTPLMAAAMSGSADVVTLLLDRGLQEVNKKNSYGSTALHRAARYGRNEVVRVLLDGGADPAIKNNQNQVALDIARKYQETLIILMLQEAMTNAAIPIEAVLDEQSTGGANAIETLPLPPDKTYHVFLTHNWGIEDANHHRVAMINKELQRRGVVTWFDADRMRGDIATQVAEGINESSAVIAFVTNDYVVKVSGKGEKGNNDSCKLEFRYAYEHKGVDDMIVVEMEDTEKPWTGPVGLYVGGHLHYSFKNDDELESCVDDLMNEIEYRI